MSNNVRSMPSPLWHTPNDFTRLDFLGTWNEWDVYYKVFGTRTAWLNVTFKVCRDGEVNGLGFTRLERSPFTGVSNAARAEAYRLAREAMFERGIITPVGEPTDA